MNSLRLYLYCLPYLKVLLGQVLFCHELHPSYHHFSILHDMYIKNTEDPLKTLFFHTQKWVTTVWKKVFLKTKKEIWTLRKRSFAVISIFLVAPSKLAYNPNVIFLLSETKVVNVSVVTVDVTVLLMKTYVVFLIIKRWRHHWFRWWRHDTSRKKSIFLWILFLIHVYL